MPNARPSRRHRPSRVGWFLVGVIALVMVLPVQPALAIGGHAAPPKGPAVRSPPVDESIASRWAGSEDGAPPPPGVPAPGFSGHYYQGSVWVGSDGYNYQYWSVNVSITTPQSFPLSGDQFYEELSIWDTTDTYDQVGIYSSGSNGWDFSWATLSNCGANQNYGTNYRNGDIILNANEKYNFGITLLSTNYTITEWVDDVYGNRLLTHYYPDNAMYLDAGQYHNCANGNSAEDYTNYEEVWAISDQNMPDWNFLFGNNSYVPQSCVRSGCPGSWGVWTNGCTNCGIVDSINGASTDIQNEFFRVGVVWPLGGSQYQIGTLSVTQGQQSAAYGYLYLDCSCSSSSISLSTVNLPTGASASFSPSSGTPPFSYSITVSASSGLATGNYFVWVEGAESGSLLAKAEFMLHVAASGGGGGGGGGGCVALNTPILTPSGYVPVEVLKSGDVLLGWNAQTSTLVNETLVSDNRTSVSEVLSINDGLLEVTLTDQPIYIMNGTFIGWLHDPQNLTPGDFIFNPIKNTWMQVNSIQLVNHPTWVFDVVTTTPNDFVANGILLDIKIG